MTSSFIQTVKREYKIWTIYLRVEYIVLNFQYKKVGNEYYS